MKCMVVLVFLSLFATFQSTQAQDWHAGDTLKTVREDSLRIDQFRDNVIDYTGQDLLDAAFPKSWPLFGTNARMAITGYAKLDYIQDFDGGYDRFQYEVQSVQVPGDGRTPQAGYMNMHVRESRANLDVRYVTEQGMPIRVFFEFDFYNLDRGPFNQALRLRHFYGVLGRLLIGRTWGTQTDLFAVPSTIDFAAGDALTATRRAQVRFEDHITDDVSYACALEMLDFPGVDGNDQPGQASNLLPLLAARLTKKTASGGRLFLSAAACQLRWDGQETGPDATALGWGVTFSGRHYFGKHYLTWLGAYGDGWSSNVISTVGSNASAILTPDGVLETMPIVNVAGSFSAILSSVLMANLSAAWFNLDASQYRAAEKITRGGSAHVNLIWSPVKSVNAGVEYMTLYRENVDGKSGFGRRLQFMIKYLF